MTSVYRLPEHPVPQPFTKPQRTCPYCESLQTDRKQLEWNSNFASCSPVKRYRYGFLRWWRRCQHEHPHVHQWCLSCRSEWIVWPASPIAPESLPRVAPPEPRPAPPPPRTVLR